MEAHNLGNVNAQLNKRLAEMETDRNRLAWVSFYRMAICVGI